MARFRLGSEMKEASYWEEEEKRKYRMSGKERESWEHVWKECRRWEEERGSWQEAVKLVLGEEGEGKWWLRELEKERQERKKRRGGKGKEEDGKGQRGEGR